MLTAYTTIPASQVSASLQNVLGIYATVFNPHRWAWQRVRVLDVHPAFQRRDDRRPYKAAEVLSLTDYCMFDVPIDCLYDLSLFIAREIQDQEVSQ
jgi:hypothetical protein